VVPRRVHLEDRLADDLAEAGPVPRRREGLAVLEGAGDVVVAEDGVLVLLGEQQGVRSGHAELARHRARRHRALPLELAEPRVRVVDHAGAEHLVLHRERIEVIARLGAHPAFPLTPTGTDVAISTSISLFRN
jgi:hypothetical protein